MRLRIKREKNLYNKGAVDRSILNKLFEHANNCLSWRNQGELIRKYMVSANDKTVLEIGSTSWAGTIDFKEINPKKLICINISEKELQNGIKEARRLGHYDKIDFKIMDAHNLCLADNSIDVIFGIAILHHLEFEQAINGFYRVLKRGGIAIFAEPLGLNPFGILIRFLTPNARTPDEHPLGLAELRLLRKYFETKNRYFQLFAVPAGLISRLLFKDPVNPLTRIADKIDLFVEKRLPLARPFFRYVTIYCKKM